MKKFLVACILGCLSVSAFAVDLPGQGFGIQIGWAAPTLRLNSPRNPSNAKDSLSNNLRMKGFKLGVMYDASYIAGFGSTIGVNYTFGVYNSGWEQIYPNNDLLYDRMLVTYHQIEMYVDWQYKFEIAKETYLMLYTGPTIQCGLGLNMHIDKREENYITGERTVTYGDEFSAYKVNADDTTPNEGGFIPADNAIRRLNITWGVGAGFQYKRYFLRGGYDFGLLNPYRNADFVNGNHTRGRFDQWSIKIGVYLWYNND